MLQVDVRKAAFRVEYHGMMPRGSGPMRGMRGNFRGQGARGGKHKLFNSIF